MIFHYICKKKKMLAMIFLPTDTALLPIIIIGMLIYYALQSLSEPPKKKGYTKEDAETLERIFRENSPDYRRYQRWLEEHQQSDK